MKIAITGATGFVGAETLTRALAAGHEIAALTRKPQEPRAGVRWVAGDLNDDAALDALVTGADAVLHIAGVVNAPDRAGFMMGNADGTAHLIDAMKRRDVRRLVHVSSLAAREPDLSDYGWSKAEAERHVLFSHLDWTMVRPPAIYGGGDKDMHELFVMAQKGVVLLPPKGRFSVIEVGDLADMLLATCADRAISLGQCYEVDDGTPGGWTHPDFARAIGVAVGRAVIPLCLPPWMMWAGARIDRMLRGARARLTPDRARYLCHADWTSHAALAPPPVLWSPHVPTATGLAATVAAYRAKGWL